MEKITITSKDFVNAAAAVLDDSELLKKVVDSEPLIRLAFTYYAAEICLALFGESEGADTFGIAQ